MTNVETLGALGPETLGPWGRALVSAVVAVGALGVVPLGLRLIDGAPVAWLGRRWLVGAVPGVVSLWLPCGLVATCLAAGYALATVALAAQVPLRFAVRRSWAPSELAVFTALTAPAVAGSALLAERAGYPLLGFTPQVLQLTVAHFHYAGFAAALVSGLVCRAAGTPAVDPAEARQSGEAGARRSGEAVARRTGNAAALSVPAGTALVFAGYFTNDWVELAGAAWLTVGMWLVAWLTWRQLRPSSVSRLTGAMLAISAATLVATMLLALDWALGEATGVPHLPLRWMAATHGLANAFGFALCGILAWRRLKPAPL